VLGARYGLLIMVRKGQYARASESSSVIRAWRVGGRLTCRSALEYHAERVPGDVLHVEVPGNTARVHAPDNHRKLLCETDRVVVHWARKPSHGTVRTVSSEAGGAQSAVCRGYAGTRSSASRMV
jgi:hypothetical protein